MHSGQAAEEGSSFGFDVLASCTEHSDAFERAFGDVPKQPSCLSLPIARAMHCARNRVKAMHIGAPLCDAIGSQHLPGHVVLDALGDSHALSTRRSRERR